MEYAMHGRGPLRSWYDTYRGRANYMKATSALARRISEALWWVLVRDEAYRFWHGEPPRAENELFRVGNHLVDAATGEVLHVIDSDPPGSE